MNNTEPNGNGQPWDGLPKRKPRKREPVIRANNKTRPYVKATIREIAAIVEFVAEMIVKQKTKHEIHKAVDEKFHKTWSACDQMYIPRAYALLRERANMTRDEARSFGVGVLLDVVRTGNNRERLGAIEQLSKIYGINAPTKTEVSGPDGAPIQTETSTKEPFDFDGLRRLQELERRPHSVN